MEGIEVETVAVYDNGPAPETGGAVGEASLRHNDIYACTQLCWFSVTVAGKMANDRIIFPTTCSITKSLGTPMPLKYEP